MEIKKIKIKTQPKIFVIFRSVGKGQTNNFFLALEWHIPVSPCTVLICEYPQSAPQTGLYVVQTHFDSCSFAADTSLLLAHKLCRKMFMCKFNGVSRKLCIDIRGLSFSSE